MNTLTHQEMFDKVVAHARKQKVKAIDTSIVEGPMAPCIYGSPSYLQCFASIFLDHEKNITSLEGASIEDIWNYTPEYLNNNIPGDALPLLMCFQCTHDEYEPDQWEEQFKIIAVDNNFIYSPPELHT